MRIRKAKTILSGTAVLSAAFGAAVVPSGALAAEVLTQFSISGWMPTGDGVAYGLSGDPTLLGSFTLTDGTLTDLNFVTGARSWSVFDVTSANFTQSITGEVYQFGFQIGGSGYVHSNNTAFIIDANGGLYCNDCVSLTSSSVVSAAAVPEPATWAMMLLGFGFIGGAMRASKRKQKLTVSYA